MMKRSYQNAWLNWVQRVTSGQEDVWQSIATKINPIHDPRIIPLEPGVELDTMIGRQALNWNQENVSFGDRGGWDNSAGQRCYLNRFSTDIKAAWELAEKFQLCVVPFGDGWTATRLGQILVDSERNKAATAPHAICLAALWYTW